MGDRLNVKIVNPGETLFLCLIVIDNRCVQFTPEMKTPCLSFFPPPSSSCPAGMHHEGYYYVVSEREHFLQDMAPECLWDKCYSVCSDAWSYGILVYRTVTFNSIPFPNIEVNELHGRMVGGERPQLLASFSNEL